MKSAPRYSIGSDSVPVVAHLSIVTPVPHGAMRVGAYVKNLWTAAWNLPGDQ